MMYRKLIYKPFTPLSEAGRFYLTHISASKQAGWSLVNRETIRQLPICNMSARDGHNLQTSLLA